MTPIIDDYVGKYYQKRNNQSIINKKAFLHLSSHCMYFLSKRTLFIFLFTKRYSVSKNNEKKRQLFRKRSDWQAMIAHDDSLRMGLDGSLRIGSDGSLRIGSDGSLRIGPDDSLRISLALTR